MSGGYAKYLQRMVPLLAGAPEIEQLEVLLPPQLESLAGALGPLAKCWPSGSSMASRKWIRGRVRSLDADVVFIPTARWMWFKDVPTVVMVRNMEPLSAPWEGHTIAERARNAARYLVARNACTRASRVIAVSRHVRDFLLAAWHIDSDRIGLVYHGVDEPETGFDDTGAGNIPLEPGKFVFTAGSIRPARGLEDLLRAWQLVGPRHADFRLVIAGSADPGTTRHERFLRRLATDLGIADTVVWTNRLGPEQMRWHMTHAAAFVMTSRAEACPNVALEALSFGALCLSTDSPPMPEFFGDAARYYRAGNPKSLAALLDQTLVEKAQGRYREAARVRASRFNWSDTLRGTLAQLAIAAKETRPKIAAAPERLRASR
jgi:glycosyltransferase involved in cell wall biosynthesis